MGFSDLRLVLVGPLPPPSGGMANQTEQLARLLQEEGSHVRLVATNAPYRPAWIGRLRGVRALWRLGAYRRALRRALPGAGLVHVMANSGWAWHLRAAPAIRAARRAGVPVVVNYRGGEAEVFFARSFRWVEPTLRQADAVIVPSGFLEAVFSRRGIAVHIVPNVIDLHRFRPASPRPAGPAPHVVVARNLEAIYDIPTALRAFATLRTAFPGARLSVAGSGPLRSQLRDLARDLGIAAAVTFTGRLDNARMAGLYAGADLVLNPSRADNMPISILEALASGVPVVSTNVGGVPFLVEDGRTALLVPPGDPQAMAASTMRILGEPALAASLRGAGLEAIQHYAWPAVRERLLAVYGLARSEPPLDAARPAPRYTALNS
ncbi:MAG: glycosyltransferase family 4 protein [Candidatus Rokubacteria bacterium]|nr:glycosyltransferase family 4 protein [Candidatus Rokubacteria bacterium]